MQILEALKRTYQQRGYALLLEWLFVGSVALIFWPITRWVFSEALGKEQFLQALMVIGLAGVFVIRQRSGALDWRFHLDSLSGGILSTSIVLAFFATWVKQPLIIPFAFVVAITGLVAYAFGKKGLRQAFPLLLVFLCYLYLMLAYPLVDFPLRAYAAKYSAQILQWLQLAPEIAYRNNPSPTLLLLVKGGVYEVAPECNGFGLMSACLLLGILIALKSTDYIWMRLLGIVAALFLGAVGNLLRIVVIIILAPYVQGHYHIMHEIIGTIAFFLTLLSVGWLLWHKSTWNNPKNKAT